MAILVLGGAGYIGSHAVDQLSGGFFTFYNGYGAAAEPRARHPRSECSFFPGCFSERV